MNNRSNIQAVLLDMDGTLLDTERVHLDSLVAALKACGQTDDVVALGHAMIGLPSPQCDEMLRDRYGKDFALDELDRAFRLHQDEILARGMPLKTGAVALLDALHGAGLPVAIVTSSSRRTADRYLMLAGLRSRFQAVLTRDDVARSKPYPDLYLLAARGFGLEPQRCVAIEDSNPGVEAACAAGALTIMVPDIVPPTEAARAKCVAVLPDLGAVLELLRARGVLARS